MLKEIIIENLAVIEKARVSFGGGFTVLTGETGAGKSIIIDSIQAILGNRTSKDLVRSGADKARIWATFQNLSVDLCQRLEAFGYPVEEELILQREISGEGKNQCRINGLPATASVLKEIGATLVQIHGQHDNHSLTSEAKHLPLLDLYAANDLLRERYVGLFQQWQSTKKSYEALQMNEAEKVRKLDLLRYEIQEIEAAQLKEGEEEALLERRNRLKNAQNLMFALHAAQSALDGDENDEEAGALTLLGQACGQLESAAEIDPPLATMAENMREMYYTAQELARELQHSIHSYEDEEGSLDELEERLDLFYRLKQKYGGNIQAVILYGSKAKQELDIIEGAGERLQALLAQMKGEEKQVHALAEELSKNRLQAFEQLRKEIQNSLQDLNMAGACLALQHEQGELGMAGQDRVEFLFSANQGETPKPLAKIASGGELSRVMLAIKNALALRDEMPTVIYDEIDTGISGGTAGKIGRMMQAGARERQVLCVTHTAQIAAYADEQLLISKSVEHGRTYTSVRQLDREERINELARIISGESFTSVAKANATEMLDSAQKTKK